MKQPIDAVLGLGSNIGDGPKNIRAALDSLAGAGVEPVRVSSLYRTSPVGPQNQPDYTNAAALVRTTLLPQPLLELCKRIEHERGRGKQETRWGPRTIDIDILIYGSQSVQTPDLTIPHPEMENRLFVLTPLLEVAAHLELPDGTLVREFAQNRISALELSSQKIKKIVDNF